MIAGTSCPELIVRTHQHPAILVHKQRGKRMISAFTRLQSLFIAQEKKSLIFSCKPVFQNSTHDVKITGS